MAKMAPKNDKISEKINYGPKRTILDFNLTVINKLNKVNICNITINVFLYLNLKMLFLLTQHLLYL